MSVIPLISTCEHYVSRTRFCVDRTFNSKNMQARRTAAIIESAKILGIKWFKQKQVEAVESFLSGKDTFVSLPTGYGKSVIYAALPLAFDTLKGKL